MMLIKILIISFLISSLNTVHAVEQKNFPLVKNIVNVFKSENISSISKLVSYPLEREYPIPPIRNESEFIARFNQLFDHDLRRAIVSSNIARDWNEVGWRGIMLNDGDIWLDYDGKIMSINYQSKAEKNLKNYISARGRGSLHRSVNAYAQSIIQWNTKRFYIRVDDVGQGQLRYAAWPVGTKTTDKPDIVLLNGELVFDGSGRNHRYIFKNGDFSYQLNINALNAGELLPGTLEVYKGNKRLLSEAAMEINRR
jgi:hypothetical protein